MILIFASVGHKSCPSEAKLTIAYKDDLTNIYYKR